MPERRRTADDAAKAIFKLIGVHNGDIATTRGGKRKRRRRSDRHRGGGGGGDGAEAVRDTNPMRTPGAMIVGGVAGAPLELPPGSEGMVLAIVGGAPTWVRATIIGVEPNYLVTGDGDNVVTSDGDRIYA